MPTSLTRVWCAPFTIYSSSVQMIRQDLLAFLWPSLAGIKMINAFYMVLDHVVDRSNCKWFEPRGQFLERNIYHQRHLSGPVSYRDFRETGPRSHVISM